MRLILGVLKTGAKDKILTSICLMSLFPCGFFSPASGALRLIRNQHKHGLNESFLFAKRPPTIKKHEVYTTRTTMSLRAGGMTTSQRWDGLVQQLRAIERNHPDAVLASSLAAE